ncbi:hypothetical protein Peur_024540 [Populus x canadensis]
MNKLCAQFSFKQHNSSMYNAPANGLAEAFNKTLCNILKKVVNRSKKDWHERIGEALWAYHTTFRTPTQATPYSLFLSKWDGPYVVQEVYTNGAYKIVDENGLRIGPINGKFLKRYYA